MAFKLLVVDDNAGDRLLLKEAIEQIKMDCQLTYAMNGREAVRLVFIEKPDLILMDIMMPGSSGGDAVRQLKTNFRYKQIPIIFLSGVVSPQEEGNDKGIVIGDEKYPCLSKPVDPVKLFDIMNGLLAKS